MLDEHVELLEGARIEQQLDALARAQFAPLVLRLDTLLAAAEARALALFLKPFKDMPHVQ
jgi:hypothetical protein